MKLNKLMCSRCGGQDFKGFAKGDHVGIRCRDCGAHVKWASKLERVSLEDFGEITLSEDPRSTLGDPEISVSSKLDLLSNRLDTIEAYLEFGDPSPKEDT